MSTDRPATRTAREALRKASTIRAGAILCVVCSSAMLFPVRANPHANVLQKGRAAHLHCMLDLELSQPALVAIFIRSADSCCVLAANSLVDPTDQPHISPCLAAHLSTMFLFWTEHYGLAQNALRPGHIKMASFPSIQSHESDLSSRIPSTRSPSLYC